MDEPTCVHWPMGEGCTGSLVRRCVAHGMQKEEEKRRKIEKSLEDARMERIEAMVEEARQRGDFIKPVSKKDFAVFHTSASTTETVWLQQRILPLLFLCRS